MRGILYKIENIYLNLVSGITLSFFLIIGYILAPFFKRKTRLWKALARLCLSISFLLSFIRIKTQRMEKIPKSPCVIAMNHRSLMDTLSMIVMFNRNFFVITEPFDAFPNKIICHWAKNLGYIAIIRDEKDKKHFKEGIKPDLVVKECIKRLKEGKTLLIYPEAHYERNKDILKFKTGAVRCALEAGVPLIPGVYIGTEKIVTPGHNRIHPGKIIIKFGEPMNLKEYYEKQDDRALVNRLTNELREEISKLKNLK